MFQYEWEELNIDVELKPDKTFATINIDQRSETPSATTVQNVLTNQRRFQTIEMDNEDLEDLIEGRAEFYEFHMQVSTKAKETQRFILPSKLLSTSPEEQEEEIAWFLEELGILEELQEKMQNL